MIAQSQQISQLGPVYGCYISEAPASDPKVQGLLDELNIQQIFEIQPSLTQQDPCHERNKEWKVINVQSELVDDALDIIEATAYSLAKALVPSQQDVKKVLLSASGPAVTAHLHAVMIALVMMGHRIGFSSALSMLRETGTDIQVSIEVERQLRIWHFCEYCIRRQDPSVKRSLPTESSATPKLPGSYPLSPPTSRRSSVNDFEDLTLTPKSVQAQGDAAFKPAYLTWRKERAALNAAKHLSALAKRAAALARARSSTTPAQSQCRETQVTSKHPDHSSDDRSKQKEVQAAWKHVEDMERTWNARLMGGATSIQA